MGVLPSASLASVPVAGQPSKGMYEPIRGTAPDIAGQGIANPIGSILSMALMVRYSLGLTEEAAAVELAVEQALSENHRTADIAAAGSNVIGTVEMGDRIVAALQAEK
jgi:3-isopropylmalate dehydrogenase